MLALLVTGCNSGAGARPTTQAGEDDLSFLVPRADTGLDLRVQLRRDTISATSRAPVEVVYFVVNGPTMTKFDNNPGHFGFTVTTGDGSPVPPSLETSPILVSEGPRVEMVLPAGALIGQVQDLRCIVQGRFVRDTGRRRTCLKSYDFARPGTYQVIVEYRGPDTWPDLDSLIAADSGWIGEVTGPLSQGRRLADTATLVVR